MDHFFTSCNQASEYGRAMTQGEFDALTAQYDTYAQQQLASAAGPTADLLFMQSQMSFIDHARAAFLGRIRPECRLELVDEH